jgi:crotonobetaine/carnitine-CoA ligase
MSLRPLRERTVVSVLERAVASGPDRVALRDPSTTYSYADVWRHGAQFAGGLRSIDVASHDTILLMLDNHVDFVNAHLGAAFIGAIEVPINTAYKGGVLAHVINDSQSRILVIEETYLSRVVDIASELKFLKLIVLRTNPPGERGLTKEPTGWDMLSFEDIAQHEEVQPIMNRPSDVLAVMYTSGTTGPSKGVLLPHAHAYTVGASRPHGGGWLDTDHDDVNYVFLPLYHQAGQWGGVLNAFIAQASAYLAPRFSASTFLDDVRRVGGSVAGFVGSAGAILLQQPERSDDSNNPLREISMSPLVSNVEEFEHRFDVKVTTSYGSTEVGCVLVDDDPTLRRGTYHPRDGYQLRIVDEEDIEVPTGEVGELIIRTPDPWTSLIGYHNNPEQTIAMWRNGWLHTGDALRITDDGAYQFIDRIKDCIRRRGENISSLEVEREVASHPLVRECAAFAVPSELGEDEVMVAIVVDATISLDDLIDYLSQRMPTFMLPRYIRVVDEFPRTPTAKVQKAVLRDHGSDGAWDREAHREPKIREPIDASQK